MVCGPIRAVGLLAALSLGVLAPPTARGADLVEVQAALKDRGYCDCPTDGRYDEVTARAVELFQEDNGLEPTGRLDNRTLEALFSSGFRAAPDEPSPASRSGPSRAPSPLDVLGDSAEILAPMGPRPPELQRPPEPSERPVAASAPQDHSWFDGSGISDPACRRSADAALAGDGLAQYNLGICLWTGEGAERDRPAALRWFRIAAANGSSAAIDMVERIEAALGEKRDAPPDLAEPIGSVRFVELERLRNPDEPSGQRVLLRMEQMVGGAWSPMDLSACKLLVESPNVQGRRAVQEAWLERASKGLISVSTIVRAGGSVELQVDCPEIGVEAEHRFRL